jgi:hypothetical protein
MTFGALIRRPSAAIPLVMSLAAFLLIIAVLLIVGVTDPQDEGTPARVFQLLMVLQVLMIGFFAVRWLPRSPRPALLVLCLQVGAALLAIATVAWLECRGAV